MDLTTKEVLVGIFFIVAGFIISQGSAVKCYACGSVNSLDECHGRIKKITCPNGYDRCLKANWTAALFGDVSEGFLLGCARNTMCKWQNYTYCTQTSGKVSCGIHCCEDNLCNAGSIPGLSLILTILVVIWSILFLSGRYS